MLIVDAHVHLWGSGKPNTAHRQIPVQTGEALIEEMDAIGVDAAVIQPPSWDPTGNEFASAAAAKHPKRFAILGSFPLDKPESRLLVDTWKQRPGMKGLRFTFAQPGQDTWPTDGTMDWLWPAAERAGLPVALAAANFLPTVGTIAARYPGLRLTIDHLGMPVRTTDDAGFVNLPMLLDLAKYPNVAVKTTAVPSNSTAPYPYRNIHKYLRQIYDSFGPERMFWGSDITRLNATWKQCLTLFTEEFDWLTPADKELIMGRALCRWIDWNL